MSYAELSRELREPLRLWWRGTGCWLLLGLFLLGLLWMRAHLVALNYSPAEDTSAELGKGYSAILNLISGILFSLFSAAVSGLLMLSAVVAYNSISHVVRDTGAQMPSPQTAFLSCLHRCLPVLMVFFIVRFAASIIWMSMHADDYYYTPAGTSLGHTTLYTLSFLPLILVGVGLLVATGQTWYSWLLLAASYIPGIADQALYSSKHSGSTNLWYDKNAALFFLAIMISGALVAGLFYGLSTSRNLWVYGYWSVVGGYVLKLLAYATVVEHRTSDYRRLERLTPLAGEVFRWLDGALLNLGYLFTAIISGPSSSGDWMGQRFDQWFPAQESVLGLLTGVIPVLWPLLWYSAMFFGIYWLLGLRTGQGDQHGGRDAAATELLPISH